MGLEPVLIIVRTILAAPIRMVDEVRFGLSQSNSALPSLYCQALFYAFAGFPADNPARKKIQHNGQIKPALKRYARDTEFHLKLSREMQVRNAIRECLNFKFEDSSEGKFIETILAAQGKLEREQNDSQAVQNMRARVNWIDKHSSKIGNLNNAGWLLSSAKETNAKRIISLGMIDDILVLVIVHTDRGGVTRIISARPAKRSERSLYEEAIRKRTDN